MKRQRTVQNHDKLMKSFLGELTYRMLVLGAFATIIGSMVAIG